MKKIFIGSDKSGFVLKEAIKQYLLDETYEVEDIGTTDEAAPLPFFEVAYKGAQKIQSKEYTRGILICGTGIGISIAANKIRGVRAALCHDTFSAHATREHNDANILAMGERVIGPSLALDIVDAFLTTKFEGERHQTRIDKITQLEEKYLGLEEEK